MTDATQMLVAKHPLHQFWEDQRRIGAEVGIVFSHEFAGRVRESQSQAGCPCMLLTCCGVLLPEGVRRGGWGRTHRVWLSEEAGPRLRRIGREDCPARPGGGDRRVSPGLPHVLKGGCRWRDVPAAYGPPTTGYNRFARWVRPGRVWQRLFERMAAARPVPEELCPDSTHVEVHRRRRAQ